MHKVKSVKINQVGKKLRKYESQYGEDKISSQGDSRKTEKVLQKVKRSVCTGAIIKQKAEKNCNSLREGD